MFGGRKTALRVVHCCLERRWCIKRQLFHLLPIYTRIFFCFLISASVYSGATSSTPPAPAAYQQAGHFFSGCGCRPVERRFRGQTYFYWQTSLVFPAPSPALRGCGEPFESPATDIARSRASFGDQGATHRLSFPQAGQEKLAAAKAEFAALELDGIIRRSSSPWASPLHMVKKPDGSWRCCGDYRWLNNVTVLDTYPLPNMMDFSSRVSGCSIFTKIDLRKGYYQIPMHPADILKTAIITPLGFFEFLRLTFRLRNAGSTFQQLMDRFDFASLLA